MTKHILIKTEHGKGILFDAKDTVQLFQMLNRASHVSIPPTYALSAPPEVTMLTKQPHMDVTLVDGGNVHNEI